MSDDWTLIHHYVFDCPHCRGQTITDPRPSDPPMSTIQWAGACWMCKEHFEATFVTSGRRCPHCEGTFVQAAGAGRPRKWCYDCMPVRTVDYDAYNRQAVALNRWALNGKHGKCCVSLLKARSEAASGEDSF